MELAKSHTKSAASASKEKNSFFSFGQAVNSSAPFFQPKLTVNTPGDAYEKQADAVADQVMSAPANQSAVPVSITPVSIGNIQRDGNGPRKEKQDPVLDGFKTVGESLMENNRSFPPFLEQLKLKSWDQQPPAIKGSVIGFGIADALILSAAFALDPKFRGNTILALDGVNLMTPVRLIPKTEYFTPSAFEFHLPDAAHPSYEFNGEFDLKPYFDALHRSNAAFPKISPRFELNLNYTPATQSLRLVGGTVNLDLFNRALSVKGGVNQFYTADPQMFMPQNPMDSPVTSMLSLPSEQVRDTRFSVTIDVPRLFDVITGKDDAPVQRKCADCEKEESIQRKPSFFSGQPVQRKCAACEAEENKVNRKESSNSPSVNEMASVEQTINSKGQPLQADTRSFMEERFDRDFSQVQIHNDTSAHQSSADINALAYTHQNHIAFGANQYQPDSAEGKKLLAHELTHVVQQTPGIQRALDNTGHDLTSMDLSGDVTLEKVFDNEAIVKAPSVGDHVSKLQSGLVTLSILPASGVDGKYGNQTSNAVRDFQRRAGMSFKEQDGIVGRKTIGLLDHSLRNGAISTNTNAAADDFTFTPEASAKCTGPKTQDCSTWYSDIDKLVNQGITLIDKVLAEQLPPRNTPAANYVSVFTTLFRNNDSRPFASSVADMRKNYLLTRDFMRRLLTERSLIVCGTICDGGCASGSPAYHQKIKDPPFDHIVFCESFRTDNDRLLIVIHESHHAAVPGSKDNAYSHERLINILDFQKALVNAASFHSYARAVADPSTAKFGHAVDDKNTITNSAEKSKVDLSLANIEHWFSLLPFDLSVTVSGVRDAKNTGTYKDNSNAEIIMTDVLHPWFGLTPAPARPTQTDLDKVTAIKQRSEAMKKIVAQPYTIAEVAGASSWRAAPVNVIELNRATITLPEPRLCMALLQEMVHVTPGISADVESLYVGMINEMRNGRNLDPV